MSPELIGILAVGVALAGLVLTAGCMTAATLRRLRSDMKQLRDEMRGEMEQLRNEVRALAARVGTLELRVGALEQRMARLEGADLYHPADVSGPATD